MMRVICQFKIWTIIVLSFFVLSSKGQVYQSMPQYGYSGPRFNMDSTLSIPTVCGVPTLKSNLTKKAAIAFDSCNNRFYQYNPKTLTWSQISGGGGTPAGSNGYVQFNQNGSFGATDLYWDNDTKLLGINTITPQSPLDIDVNNTEQNTAEFGTIGIQSYAVNNAWIGDNVVFNGTQFTRKKNGFTGLFYFQGKEGQFRFGDNDVETSAVTNGKSENGVVSLKTNLSGMFAVGNMSAVSSDTAGAKFVVDSAGNIFIPKLTKSTKTNVIGYDTITKKLTYQAAGSGTTIDTTSLSNRINQKLNIVDTANKFVSSVTKLNDSTIRVIKGSTTTDITLTPTATRLVTSVYNNSGATITKGSVIYINGRHSSNLPTIAKAQANTESNSYSTFALVQDDIINNNSGLVIQAGNIGNLNLPTSSYADGQVVYLSPTTAGGITTTKPLSPYHIVKIGTVTRAHPTLGSIELKIENGWQLDELSDVKIALVPADSVILQFSRVDSLWHDVSVKTAIGKKVDTIYKNTNRDSIVFTINGTRYAVRDSIGSGGGGAGNPAGSNGYVQFNDGGSFGADSSIFWNNSNKRLGLGTTQPRTKLDVAFGKLGNMPYNYEMAAFSRDGDAKLGVYNADNYGGGTSITLGNIKNLNANSRYPGFEFQNVNDSETFGNSYVRYNYLERGTDGNVAAANVDLFNIYADGRVQLNPYSYSLSANPRLIIGEDNTGATLEVLGNAYIDADITCGSDIIINGSLNIPYGAFRKHVNFLNDSSQAETYYATDQDNIIIYATYLDNCEVFLPDAPVQGQEIIIKQSGETQTYGLYVNGNGHDIWFDEVTQSNIQVPDTAPHSITLIYNSNGNGFWYVLTY